MSDGFNWVSEGFYENLRKVLDRDRNVSDGFRKVPGRYQIMSGRCLMSAGVMKVFKRYEMIPARC